MAMQTKKQPYCFLHPISPLSHPYVSSHFDKSTCLLKSNQLYFASPKTMRRKHHIYFGHQIRHKNNGACENPNIANLLWCCNKWGWFLL